ncbi:MAG: 5,6-dimethylbenzimidazole synthase [Rhodospirillales bacterium CG15_BIG_FIL_POST_REV_8_21_14_020_66_15]|nr:MAG: 5,6-dimethylbenzimidazole synthase [Rhodospirillales bacterium CG15_BIG_FIL_POST_REV_8_21_14_020_66_15]
MENTAHAPLNDHRFSDDERRALYEALYNRRDTRAEFLPTPVSNDMLARVLTAAHYAPSVGFMQPWSFTVIRSADVKRRVHALFEKAHGEAAEMFEGPARETYRGLKLEGILEAPVNICVTCDKDRAGPVVVGRTHIKAMDVYSSVCAVQNLWLAARAEGLGVGWVSIFDQKALKKVLGIPRRVVPVAYLCLGHVSRFHEKPELQKAGWRPRLPVDELVHFDHWGEAADGDAAADDLLRELREAQTVVEGGAFARPAAM